MKGRPQTRTEKGTYVPAVLAGALIVLVVFGAVLTFADLRIAEEETADIVTVPNVAKEDPKLARTRIELIGLRVAIEHEGRGGGSLFADPTVTGQTPFAGTEADVGSTVTLRVHP